MSVLHSRITQNPAPGSAASGWHPYGTQATPMVMPVAVVHFNNGTGLYDELYPSPAASADPNAVPLATVAPGVWGKTPPAGRP